MEARGNGFCACVCVCVCVFAGAAEWKRMSEAQKAPWQKLASAATKKYVAAKQLSAFAAPAKAKPAAAKLGVVKPKAGVAKAKPGVTKPKLGVTKASAGGQKTKSTVGAAVSTTSKGAASARKSPTTIKKIKVRSVSNFVVGFKGANGSMPSPQTCPQQVLGKAIWRLLNARKPFSGRVPRKGSFQRSSRPHG